MGASIPEYNRAVMSGAFQSAHEENAARGERPRTSTVVRRMRQVEAAAIKLLEALDYTGGDEIAETADELLDEPPEHPMPRPKADAYVWRQMVNAARLGDPVTRGTAWGIEDPERFLHDLWLWGHTARQIRTRWKDPGGQPAAVDQFVIRVVREELTDAGIGFRYKSEPELSGPAWQFIQHLRRLRPTLLTGSSESLDRYIRRSRIEGQRRRTTPRLTPKE